MLLPSSLLNELAHVFCMKHLYFILFFSVSIGMFVAGAYIALPDEVKDYARVKIGKTTLLVEVAHDANAWQRGLSGRTRLAESSGMLFVFGQESRHAIWMKDMRFAIDIFWIRDGRVVDLVESVVPSLSGTADAELPIYIPDAPAGFVLETAAGFAAKQGIVIGDQVGIILDGDERDAMRGQEVVDAESAAPLVTQYFIDTLLQEGGRGKNFEVGKELESMSAYRKYRVSYSSDGLMVSGIMNVPASALPKSGFPVLILNHGLIPPAIYISGRGSKREADYFARNGYVTIHPDYRGHASSSPNPYLQHDFYVGYSRDVMNLIDALKIANPHFIDLDRLGMWGHSMGGGIAARVMVVRPEIRAYVLFAPISADAEENYYELSADEVLWLRNQYDAGKNGREYYDRISPLNYFDRVSVPVQLHHGMDDKDVPIAFSKTMYEKLRGLGKKVEFFIYPGQKHEFIEDWPLAAERSLQFFDRYVKNMR